MSYQSVLQKNNLAASLLLLFAIQVNGYGRYYSDCMEFIKSFGSTCGTYAVDDITTATGTDFTCKGPQICVGSDTYENLEDKYCTQQYKLCITCTSTNLYDQYADTYIRVQTNGMPKMCWSIPEGSGQTVNYNNIDFSVIFNKNVFGMYNVQPATIEDSTTRDAYMCDKTVTKSDNIPSGNAFSYATGYTDNNQIVGITIKNQIIMNALTDDGGDVNRDHHTAYQSITYNDNCMHSAWNGNFLSIKMLSNCLAGDFASQTTYPDICYNNWLYGKNHYGSSANKPFCDEMNDIEYYFTMNFTSTADYGGIMGIAKDGHVIYGPYNKHGEIWECDDLDVCNGHWLEDGSYGYGMTSFYPYTIGCWGPAPMPVSEAVGCSSSACVGGAMAGLKGPTILAAISLLLLNLMF